MKIININSGLGNQMFQYAFILNYKLRGCEIGFDILETNKLNYHNGYELGRVFGIKEKLISDEDKRKILGRIFYIRGVEFNFYKFLRKIIKTFTLGKYVPVFNRYVQEDEMLGENNFNEKYLKIPTNYNSYFYGFFQSYKYFQNIEDEIRKVFVFPEIPEEDRDNFEALNHIKESESISIHVRRGDYLKLNNLNVCDREYYERAVKKMFKELENKNTRKENIKFFIFSDDINWCKNNLNFLKSQNVYYVDWNKDKDSYKDMQLMNECKHNIIPNSTFSWWGVWLNQNKNKIIIAPKYWFKDVLNSNGRCPDNWFRI